MTWQAERSPQARLCVAQDGRLVLLREQGAPAVTLERGGRRLAVEPEKPVFVLDLDELVLEGAHVRLHVHGDVGDVHAPQPVAVEPEVTRATPRWLLAGAAALALGATAGFGGQASEPESRPAADAASTRPDAGPTSKHRPIEVREVPPVPPPPPPKTGCGGCSGDPSAST